MINPYKKLKLRGNTSKENRAESLLHSPILTLHSFDIISVELYGPNSKVPVNKVVNYKQFIFVPLSFQQECICHVQIRFDKHVHTCGMTEMLSIGWYVEASICATTTTAEFSNVIVWPPLPRLYGPETIFLYRNSYVAREFFFGMLILSLLYDRSSCVFTFFTVIHLIKPIAGWGEPSSIKDHTNGEVWIV